MSFGVKSRSSGAFEQTRLFPAALDPTGKFFVDQNGVNPCFGLGEDAAELATSLDKSDIEIYLNDCDSKGINLLWIQSLENILSPNPPNNFYGDAPFTGGVDFVNPNEAFWLNMDYVVRRCHDHGITVVFNPMFFGLDNSSGYRASIMGSSDSVLRTFAGFLAARYGRFANLFWLVGGDLDPNNATGMAKVAVFAAELKRLMPNRLITMEASRFKESGNGGGLAPNGGYSSADAFTVAGISAPWCDINWNYQTEATTISGAQRCYLQLSAMIGGEYGYELEVSNGVTMTSALLRVQSYGSLLAGCVLGHLFGNGAIWSFNRGSIQSGNPWKGQLNSTGRLDFQRFGKLARSRAFHKLVPDRNNSVMTVSTGCAAARTSDGQSILAYVPSSQTITIDMSKITDAGSQAKCWWYDPTNGSTSVIGTFANSGTRNFTTPGNNAAGDADWVIVIDSAAAAIGAPAA